MDTTLYFSLLLLLPLCLVDGAESETFCSAMNGETLHYTIRSRKNETSHRIVSVDLQKVSIRNKGNNATTDVDMDVTHTFLQYGGKERIMLSTVASTTEFKSSVSRADYEFFPGLGYYKLHKNGVDWQTARSICVGEGGHLMVINSEAEAEVVKKFFSRKPEITGARNNNYVFVGVHDYLKEGEYMAVTDYVIEAAYCRKQNGRAQAEMVFVYGQANGSTDIRKTSEPLDKTGYIRWGPSEPDGTSASNYIVVDKDGLLHDTSNPNKYGFICEQ